MKNIAIFASGNGTNAENIIRFFNSGEGSDVARVVLVICNRQGAGVIKRAEDLNVPVSVLSAAELGDSDRLLGLLEGYKVDLIVLAGYLKLIPNWLVEAYNHKIVNIHPALLPKYGGKGMYGSKIHKAVVEAREPETGITIHYVNERYDEGEVIFQTKVEVLPTDNVEDVERKIHQLEQQNFPRVLRTVVAG